jgi:hypothetical protein
VFFDAWLTDQARRLASVVSGIDGFSTGAADK